MSTALMHRNRKLEQAAKSTVETLERRVLLAAGDLDTTFSDIGYLLQREYSVSTSWLYDTTPKYNKYAYWDDRAQPSAGFLSSTDLTIDAGGKIISVGGTLGRHLVNTAPIKYVINNPDSTTPGATTTVTVAEILDSDFILNRYTSAGADDYYMSPGNLINPGDRDYNAVAGTYPGPNAPIINPEYQSSMEDVAKAVAIDPNDGSLIVMGTNGIGQTGDDHLVLIRYSPSQGAQPGGTWITQVMRMTNEGSYLSANAMVIQPYPTETNPNDYKIIVAGSVGTQTNGQDFRVWRFNSDFTLDTTFGNGGTFTYNFNSYSSDRVMRLAVEPGQIRDPRTGNMVANPDAGKILVLGATDDSIWKTGGISKMVVQRLTVDGALDTSFGIGGTVQVGDLGGRNARSTDIAIQVDGKILLLGTYDRISGMVTPDTGEYDTTLLTRLWANGTVDTTFGARGRVTLTGTGAFTSWIGHSLALESTGKILVAGVDINGGQYASVARLTTDGVLDANYGTNGYTRVTQASNISADFDHGMNIVVQSDDKAVVSGNSFTSLTYNGGIYGSNWTPYWDEEHYDSFIARLQADNKAPQAQLLVPDVTISNPATTFQFVVDYSDDGYIDASSILDASGIGDDYDIVVTGPAATAYQQGASVVAWFGSGANDFNGNRGHFSVVYQVTFAPGWFDTEANNGGYTIALRAPTVAHPEWGIQDTQGLAALSRNLGQFAVNITVPDMTPPTAVVTKLPYDQDGNVGVVIGGRDSLDFEVTYTDPTVLGETSHNVNVSTLGIGELLVTNSRGYSAIATLVDFDPASNSSEVRARYRIAAPGGYWDVTDDDPAYTIMMLPGKVADDAGVPNYIPAGPIASFAVSVVPGTDVRPQAWLSDPMGTPITNMSLTAQVPGMYFWVTYAPSPDADPSVKIDLYTIQDNDSLIQLSSPSPSFSGFATYVRDSAVPTADGRGYIVQYVISPADGSWDQGDTGTYTVSIVGGVAADMDDPIYPPTYIPAGDLGVITVDIKDQEIPTVVSAVISPPTLMGTGYTVTVTYGDDMGIDPATITNSNLLIARTSGGPMVTLVPTGTPQITTTAGSTQVVYSFLPPGGVWNYLANGTYTVSLKQNQVRDTDGKAVAKQDLGTFTFADQAPTAGAVIFNSVSRGPNNLVVQVTYSDDFAIDVATITSANIVVERTSGGASLFLQAVGTPTISTATNGTPRTVTYTFAAPGGYWESTDNGGYEIRLVANRVKDTGGQPVAASTLGTFSIGVVDTDAPVADDLNPVPVPVLLSTTYTVTVTYRDNDNAVDFNSIRAANIEIVRVTGGALTLTPASLPIVTPANDAGVIQATYTFASPGVAWNYLANGTYEIRLVANQVKDTSGKFAEAKVLGTFAFADTTPTVVLVGNPAPALGAAPVTIQVRYTDDTGIDVSTIGNDDLIVERNDGASYVRLVAVGTPTIDDNTNGSPRTVTYTFAAPGGYWEYKDNGTWTIRLASQVSWPTDIGVRDTGGQLTPAQDLGTMVIQFAEDKVVPTATLVPTVLPDLTDMGVSSYVFGMQYADNVAVDFTSIGNDDIRVVGPNGEIYNATLVASTNNPSAHGTPLNVQYRITKAGTFTSADNGVYTIYLNNNSIFDVSVNAAAAGFIGSFRVQIGDTQVPTATIASPVVGPVVGSATYSVTVVYSDDVAIDAGTLDSLDLVVTRTGGGSAITLTSTGAPTVNPVGSGTPRSVTYTFNAPNGRWDHLANGTWTISLGSDEVRDTSGKAVAGGQLGTFTFTDQVPTATATITMPTVSATPLRVTVVLTDDYQIDTSTIDANDIVVERTDGAAYLKLQSAGAPTINNAAPGSPRTVTYSFLPPGGYWEWRDNGTYRVSIAGGEVKDVGGQSNAAAVLIDAFQLNLPTDMTLPTAALTNTPAISTTGVNSYVFEVTYTDNTAIDFSTIGDGDVTVVARDGTTYIASLVAGSVTPAASGPSVRALYRITKSGAFTDSDNGPYTVNINAGAVRDVSGNAVAADSIGTFVVQVPDSANPTAVLSTVPAVSPVSLAATYSVTVIYEDGQGIDLTMIDAADITISRTAGDTPLTLVSSGAPTIVSQNNGTRVLATYTFAAPGNTWNSLDNGTYSIRLGAGQIRDVTGNYADATPLGTFDFNDRPPVASVVAPLPAPALGTGAIQITVEYSDEVQVDATTFGAADIIVTRVGGGSAITLQSAGAPVVQPSTGGTPRRVTYSFLPPGGYWESSDNGNYSIALAPNQVADGGGQFAVGGEIGTMSVGFATDEVAPQATHVNPSTLTTMVTTYDFTIRYTDAVAVNLATLGDNNVYAEAPNGTTYQARLVSATPATGYAGTVDVVYRITNLNGFNATHTGTYTLRVGSSPVRDVSGNAVEAIRASDGITVATFRISIIAPPVTAALGSVGMVVQSATGLQFQVTFSSTFPVDPSTLMDNNNVIRVSGPRSFSVMGRYVSMTSANNGLSLTVTYSIDAPGGVWDFGDNGTYMISVATGNGVMSTVGGILQPGDVGSFTVGLTPTMLLGTTLQIAGTDDADMIELLIQSGSLRVIVNNHAIDFAPQLITGIRIYGYNGNDTVKLNSGIIGSTVYGNEGNDTLYGGDNSDTLYGNQGDDVIYGGGGDDSILAGLGNDTVYGGVGNDVIAAGDGTDSVMGDAGDDYIEGRGKADTIYGGDGNDTIYGGAGSDWIYGGAGNDRIDVGVSAAFADHVDGGAGEDSYLADDNDSLTAVETDLLA